MRCSMHIKKSNNRIKVLNLYPIISFSHIHGQLFKPPHVCMLDGVKL